MPRRISYASLEPRAADIVARALREELFPNSETSRLTFIPQGSEGISLLESALALPRQAFYPSTIKKAAALLRSLVKNHPFIDGNKRFALALVTLFLGTNGYILLATKEEVVSFILRVASENSLSLFAIERWLRKYCLYWRRKHNRDQRIETMAAAYPGGWAALQSILRDYDEMIAAIHRAFSSN